MLLINKISHQQVLNYKKNIIDCLIYNSSNNYITEIHVYLEASANDLPNIKNVKYIIKRNKNIDELVDYSKKISQIEKIIVANWDEKFSDLELKKITLNSSNEIKNYKIFSRNELPKKIEKSVGINQFKPKIVKKEVGIPTNQVEILNQRLDVIIVSVNYNDFLILTLKNNLKLFENIHVVTSTDDFLCHRICEKFKVNCIKTDIMYDGGSKFNKGKAINLAIDSLKEKGFVLILDADIIVENQISLDELKSDTIYSTGRYFINNYQELKDYESSSNLENIEYEEFKGLGFFQLFYNGNQRYPENYDDAGWSDLVFRDQFINKKELQNVILHLGQNSMNWEGRITGYFLENEVFFNLLNKKSTFTICSYYFNFRNDDRQKNNFIKFLEQWKEYHDKMIVGIVDYGDIDFKIPCKVIYIDGDPNNKIWSKEILINKIAEKAETDYILWIDGDLIYDNLDWLENIDEVVGNNDFVQLFETINYLSEDGEILESHKSLASSDLNNVDYLLDRGFKPGGSWLTKTKLLKSKPLFEKMLVGGGDTILTYALFGVKNGYTLNQLRIHNKEIYEESISWINNFGKFRVGFLREKIKHLYHGELKDRNYDTRYSELSKFITKNKEGNSESNIEKYYNNKKVVVYTCISGRYDTLKEVVKPELNIKYICFTDQDIQSETWEIKRIPEFLKHLEQTKIARCIKILPHLFIEEYEFSIWIDGNIQVIGNINKLVEENKKFYFSIPKHPDRICIYEEGKTVISLKKDTAEIVNLQIQKYKGAGYPENHGLVQSNVIIREHNNKDCVKIAEDWWTELLFNSKRDQLSFNFSIWNKDYKINIIKPSIVSSEHFQIYKHIDNGGYRARIRKGYDDIKNYINGLEV